MTVSELFKKYDFESILLKLVLRCSEIFINIGPNVRQSQQSAISDLYLVGSIQVLPLT